MTDSLASWRAAWKSDAEVGPVAQTILFENDKVRVWEIVLDPGEELAVHTHSIDYVIVTVEGSVMEVRNQQGESVVQEGRPGDTRWTDVGDGQTHLLKNVGTTRFSNRVIEIL